MSITRARQLEVVAGLEGERGRLADRAHELVLGSGRGASGRAGWAAARAPAEAPLRPCASSRSSSLTRAGHLAHRRDLALARPRRAWRLKICGRWPRSAPRAAPPARAAARGDGRPGQGHDRDRRPRLGPRRASAARTPSGSSRMRLRSSTLRSLPSAPCYFVESVMFAAGTFWDCEPEYCARNSATSWASSPTTMFSGMIAPEKPPLRIA